MPAGSPGESLYRLIAAALLAWPVAGAAQDALRLDEIVVSAPRQDTPLSRVPGAVTVVDEARIQRGTQGLSLDEALDSVPGVFTQNRYNLAQDLRVSIRGAGSRAPFGIRGVKILVDGIPATLPDGQSVVDTIEPEAVSRVEVLRGASSSLYGNASGGVIDITTGAAPATPFAGIESTAGAYGFFKNTARAAGRFDELDLSATFSRLDYDGFRDHAETESNRFNSRIEYALDDDAEITLVARALDSPRAQDPGALTAAEVASDRGQAAPGNLSFDAGERVEEQQLGVVYRHDIGEARELRLRGFTVRRDFANRLPFENGGQVAFDRRFNGAGVLYSQAAPLLGLDNRLLLGLDVERQRDDRRRFDNLEGGRGELVFDQLETVTATGAFIQSELSVTDRLTLTAGIRHDRIRFKVEDRFLADGVDDSGDRTLTELSPRIGASWFVSRRLVPYFNISSAFETPTTTELARCEGGGFVDDLDAQEAVSWEAGVTGRLSGALRYGIAVYHTRGRDKIVSRACPGQPGREFFVNAGRTTRNGVELSLEAARGPWRANLAYTFADFEFDRFRTGGEEFSDETIPGVPRHRLQGGLTYNHASGWFAGVEARFTGEFFADNANTVTNDESFVVNASAGWERELGGWTLRARAGLNNLLDEAYNSNVRVNAFGGRYFEPAPGRNAYAGLELRYELPVRR